jgi:hypothetical protein
VGRKLVGIVLHPATIERCRAAAKTAGVDRSTFAEQALLERMGRL